MMISFSPIRMDAPLTLEAAGDVLTVNGERFDFGPVSEGSRLPKAAIAADWLASDVERVDGLLKFTVILPIGPDASPDAAFPKPVTVTKDGLVEIPR